jgi:hypothetical protein
MLFKNSVRTLKRTPHFTVTKINWLTLFREGIAVYREKHKQSINRLLIAELLIIKADGKYAYN